MLNYQHASMRILSSATLVLAYHVKLKSLCSNCLEDLVPVVQIPNAKLHSRRSLAQPERIVRTVWIQIYNQCVGMGQDLDQVRQSSELIIQSYRQLRFDAVVRTRSKKKAHDLAWYCFRGLPHALA